MFWKRPPKPHTSSAQAFSPLRNVLGLKEEEEAISGTEKKMEKGKKRWATTTVCKSKLAHEVVVAGNENDACLLFFWCLKWYSCDWGVPAITGYRIGYTLDCIGEEIKRINWSVNCFQ